MIREAKSGGARADLSTELRSVDFWRGVCVECLASFLYVLLVMTTMMTGMRVMVAMLTAMLMTGLQVCLAEELSLSFTFTFRNKQLMTGFQVCLAEEAVASNPSLPASTRQVVFSLPIISTYNFHLLLLSLSVTFTFRNFHFL